MAGGRTAPRIFIAASVLTLVVALVGFIVTVVLNAFVLDKYNAYGEVPIPGSSSLHLPAGEATVSFHTQTIGSPSGGGLPVPPLGLTVAPPAGVPQPEVTENWGTTTTVNNDARIRVWVVQIPAEGTYRITTDGNVNGYINPRLAFGHGSSYGWLAWAFAGLFALGLLELTVSIVLAVRRGKRPTPAAPIALDPYTPTDDGIRIEQLKNLAALRDSGALTEDEFQAEKRRILHP
ncbi:SHOCT domain-containing protein [Mycolicibacterium moriokaense]|nr:SHOCT domain-containing protein [Mycolicibacterium moriokaense]